MKNPISCLRISLSLFFVRIFNLIAPRACVVCGRRLAVGENVICTICNIHLPRTRFHKIPYDNRMARFFWGQIPVMRATAFFYYEPHSEVCRIIYSMKYLGHPEDGEIMGRMFAGEIKDDGFFEGIDLIVPVPLAKKRMRARGYNQSMEIAQGVSQITGIPVCDDVVIRKTFKSSQTKMNRWQRVDNVEDAFELKKPEKIRGKHLLMVDDVVTTGSTIISCAKEMMKCGEVKFSIISLGFTRS